MKLIDFAIVGSWLVVGVLTWLGKRWFDSASPHRDADAKQDETEERTDDKDV